MTTSLKPIITRAGLTAVRNAQNSEFKLCITEIALGNGNNDTGWTPDNTATSLKNQKNRIPILAGEAIGESQIHMTAVEDTNLEYWVYELGFYLEDGTLFAIWSDPDQPLAYKSPGIDLLLAFDLLLTALGENADSVTIDGTGGFAGLCLLARPGDIVGQRHGPFDHTAKLAGELAGDGGSADLI